MIGKVSNAKLKPTLEGVMAQSSTYGSTIPRIIGTTMSAPLLTWLNGIRKGPSSKKGSKKGGVPTYRACCSFLIGHNPIQHVLRVISSNVGLGMRNNVINTGYGGSSFTISDPNFYALTGVTVSIPYSVTFNDYGAQGSASLSGTYELPLWNLAMQGPDPTNPSGYRWAPWTYYNLPFSTVISQLPSFSGPSQLNIYYAGYALAPSWGAGHAPLPYILNSTIEFSLGDGTEYTGYQDFTAERIIYPMFAGFGSYNFDIGMGATPQIRTEIQGSYTLYPWPIPAAFDIHNPSADADFADMVEDIFKMGQTQAALLSSGVGTATAVSPIQPGVSCWEMPGTVQKKFHSLSVQGNFLGTIQYDLPVTQGNILVAAVASASGTFGISDTLANTWTPVIATGGKGFWYAVANASGSNTLSITGVPGASDVQIFEIGGVDTVDTAPVFSASGSTVPTGTVTTTGNPSQSEYILTWVFPDTSGSVGTGSYLGWNKLIAATGQGGNYYGVGPANSYTQYQIVHNPGTYTFTGNVATSTWTVVMLAVKNLVAPSYPKPFGNILDQPSLDLCRAQCRANGLWGSLVMNSQKKAADWLSEIYTCMNSAFVWSGFKGKSIPYSEVSFAGSGAIYNAPTASGPVVNVGEDDFIGDSNSPLVSITRKATVDRPDLLRIQHPDRNNNYNTTTVPQPDVGGLSLYGLRYSSPVVLDMIQNTAVARMILGIMVRRQNYIVNTYKFKLQARVGKLLEAMDLITITESKLGISQLPVRLTSVAENDKYELDCEAEDFIYGIHDPTPLPVTQNQSSGSGSTVIPAAINTPVFLEPPGTLTGFVQDQLWMVVSDSDPQYGGSDVYVSVNGSSGTYVFLGTILGNGVTGFTTGSWPQALDPDTTNDLPVNLTESNGALTQYTTQQEDNFTFPCYVAGGGGIFPFELMTYAVANLTSAFNYTLKATGGGNYLHRGIFGTWASTSLQNTGPAHASNSRFAFLDPTGAGIFKIDVPTTWVGKTLYFKFVQFNVSGSGFSSLAAATAYPYTILGANQTGGGGTGGSGGGGNVSYTINPTNPLSQTSPTNIHMVNVTATFSPSGLQTFYVARNFTISAPVSPTTYYVTIFDPNLIGDTGNTATLTSFCTTTQAGSHVGQPGYIYMGSIVATASGTSGGGTGGGTNPTGTITIQIPIPSTTRGDFTIAHGLSATPNDVDIKEQSDGQIRFQSPIMWDATTVYLNASDDGLTGTLVIEI